MTRVGDRVVIDNGGTYQGREVKVLALEPDGCLIVRHPRGGSGRLRLQPARVNAHGVEIPPQFAVLEGVSR